MPMTRKQHRVRTVGPFQDPALEKAIADLSDASPAGLTRTVTIEDADGSTHSLVFKNGVLVEYEVT